jgi:hypothetical protein
MRCVLSLMLAVSALGIIPASSEETELGVSLASLDNAIIVGSNGNDRTDDGRNMALIKEGEFESPEMIAVIERNREDQERTVVIDRYFDCSTAARDCNGIYSRSRPAFDRRVRGSRPAKCERRPATYDRRQAS